MVQSAENFDTSRTAEQQCVANLDVERASAALQPLVVARGGNCVVALCITWLLVTFAASASGRERENETSGVTLLSSCGMPEATVDLRTLPSVEAIDAHTDIAVFLQDGVPVEVRLAALRRVWIVDPAIRDYKGLQENGWTFDDLNSMPGFGELGPKDDVATMLAQIVGKGAGPVAPPVEPRSSSLVADLLVRFIVGAIRER